ncbi:MAG TPA: hypothetical protein VL285_13835 [Bryobacteraceae bacterium]|nr:hypothetical protein [Bryobacteraceae bacterium]
MRTGLVAVLALLAIQASDTPDARLARFREVRMPFHAERYTAKERRMIDKLVEACQHLEMVFWEQSDPEGFTLLRKTTDPKLRRLLMINGSRFDFIDEHKPFAGTEPMSAGRALYPPGLTRERIEQYVKSHPEKRAQIYSPYTVVRWSGKDLVGIPYHQFYKTELEKAAAALREASALSADPAFANFLRLRADALLTDDYYKSDLAWLDLKDPKFDLIFAPYETYLDGVLGVKTSYGASILIRDEAESKKLAEFQNYVPEIQDHLPLLSGDRPSKQEHVTPMEVMDAPLRTGDLRHGYQAVADNLPNDPKIHQEKGSKKIFFRNFMAARVEHIVVPMARKLMRPDQAARVSEEGYLAGVLLHEISHELGPVYARRGERQSSINEAIGPAYGGLEEAKADVVGMFGVKWLADKGALPKARLPEYYDSYVAGIFRTLRFGAGEAHGIAQTMEFNYLTQERAILRDAATGRYWVDHARIPGAIARLSKELLEMEAAGDGPRAEAWFKKYGTVPADLKASLQSARDVPVDIDPIFSFRELPKPAPPRPPSN